MAWNTISRRAVLQTIGAGLGTGALGLKGTTPALAQAVTREDVRVPVALSPGLSKEYEIAATLTLPPAAERKSVVQLLAHGATYARYY